MTKKRLLVVAGLCVVSGVLLFAGGALSRILDLIPSDYGN